MGLYYNQNPPHIGAQQPLTERETIPQSGPTPQNPPLIGSRISQAILNAWIIPAAAIILPQLMVPQPVQAAGIVPAKSSTQEIYRAWEVASPAPIVARLLNPPISGPTPQNPPLTGATINPAVLNFWNVAPVAIALPSSIVPQVVPAAYPALRWPSEIYRAWDALPSSPVVARLLVPPISGPAPQNPPLTGALVPLAAHVAWLAPPPAPIAAKNLNPPIGAAPSNPPFTGARFATELEVSWLPAAPAPIVAVNLDPPIAGPTPQAPPFAGAKFATEIEVAWLPAAPASIVSINLDPPIAGPAPQNPPIVGRLLPLPVAVAWLPAPPAPIVGPNLVFLPAAPTNPPFNGGAKVAGEILASWLAPLPAPIWGPKFTSGGPAPQNPPFVCARLATESEIYRSWETASPAPIVARLLNPPISGGGPVTAGFIMWPYSPPALGLSLP